MQLGEKSLVGRFSGKCISYQMKTKFTESPLLSQLPFILVTATYKPFHLNYCSPTGQTRLAVAVEQTGFVRRSHLKLDLVQCKFSTE